MKASDLLVKCLENEGVRHIFGIPGEENIDVLDSLLDSKIQFIPTRHEQGAAFMADVYGRLTGKAGVCLSTLGQGATNLVTGVAAKLISDAKYPVILAGNGVIRSQASESLTNFALKLNIPVLQDAIKQRGVSFIDCPVDYSENILGLSKKSINHTYVGAENLQPLHMARSKYFLDSPKLSSPNTNE